MASTPLHLTGPKLAQRIRGRNLRGTFGPAAFLDGPWEMLKSQSDVAEALTRIFIGLQDRRAQLDESQWNELVTQCQQHPIIELLHQDPFTYRAYSKPRGYAGDAVMLDFIYGNEEGWDAPPATALGAEIFRYTTLAPAAEGVRARRGFIANGIDRLEEVVRRPHIASIAAGHFREASLSTAIKRRQCGRVMVLDADEESLQEVQRCYGNAGIETVPSPIRGLLGGKLELGQFDLVYSTGLFDYLDARIGRRLLARMFDMLRPGGRLLVANFLPGVRDVGYLETFMGWKLIYRTREEMIGLTMEIPQAEIRKVSLFAEENQNIIFVEVQRQRA